MKEFRKKYPIAFYLVAGLIVVGVILLVRHGWTKFNDSKSEKPKPMPKDGDACTIEVSSMPPIKGSYKNGICIPLNTISFQPVK